MSPYYWENGHFPVPLRPESTVFLSGIPWDLTVEEALKIVAVIEALAVDPEPEAEPQVVDAALTSLQPQTPSP